MEKIVRILSQLFIVVMGYVNVLFKSRVDNDDVGKFFFLGQLCLYTKLLGT
jgi:hypothetical protein